MVILIIGILIVMVSLITFKTEGVNEISFFILMCGISITFVGFILDCITSEYKVSEMKELENGWCQATIEFDSSSTKVMLSPKEAKFYIENPAGKISMYDFAESYSERISKTYYYKGGNPNEESTAEIESEIEVGTNEENWTTE